MLDTVPGWILLILKNYAIVEFDPKGNTTENIYGTVNAIADGKLYTVKSVETTYYRPE